MCPPSDPFWCHLFCEPMRKHVKHGCGKQSAMLHLGFKTGTGGRDGSPLGTKGSNIFRKFHSPPLSTQFLTSLVSHRRQQIHTPPTHPCQNKRHSGLRMKMRPNQDVRWDAKKYASGHAIGVRESLSRAPDKSYGKN